MGDGNKRDDDEDILNQSVITGPEVTLDPGEEIDAVIGDLEALLKNGDVTSVLTLRGINTSLALLAVSGLRSYLKGEKLDAAEDFETVAEEIRGRIASGASGPPDGADA